MKKLKKLSAELLALGTVSIAAVASTGYVALLDYLTL